MNTYQNISSELKAYFSNHPIFKVLLPLDMIFVFGGSGLIALNVFTDINSVIINLSYYALLLGLLLAYANMNEKYLYLGFFIYGGTYAWYVISHAIFIKYRFLDINSAITAMIFGWLGYLVFKRTRINKMA